MSLFEKVFLSIASIFFAIIVIKGILEFDYKIVNDKNAQTLFISSEIEEVGNPIVSMKYTYNGHIVWAKIIVINDLEFYIMTIGDFKEGDNVIVEYLPNSKVVVSINYAEE